MRSDILTHSYSGTDFNIRAVVDVREVLPEGVTVADLKSSLEEGELDQYKDLFDSLQTNDYVLPLGMVQTVSNSMAASVSSVMNVGSSLPAGVTKGAKMFAGSIVFTLLDHDPLEKLFKLSNAFTQDASPTFVSADMIPRFHIIIEGQHETPKNLRDISSPAGPNYPNLGGNNLADINRIYKIIYDVTLNQFGETVSVDDFFTEQVYQYVCRWVSPWRRGEFTMEGDLLLDVESASPKDNDISPESDYYQSNRKDLDYIDKKLAAFGQEVFDRDTDINYRKAKIKSIEESMASLEKNYNTSYPQRDSSG